jgi:hypothetical protein
MKIWSASSGGYNNTNPTVGWESNPGLKAVVEFFETGQI